MKTKKIITGFIFCVIALLSNVTSAQLSAVKLGKLIVTDQFDDQQKIISSAVSVEIVGIDSLNIIRMERSQSIDFIPGQTLTNTYYLIHKNGNHFLQLNSGALFSVSQSPMVFYLGEIDQINVPFKFFKITGVDKRGKLTNAVQFEKK
jgi:hypothetical protein